MRIYIPDLHACLARTTFLLITATPFTRAGIMRRSGPMEVREASMTLFRTESDCQRDRYISEFAALQYNDCSFLRVSRRNQHKLNTQIINRNHHVFDHPLRYPPRRRSFFRRRRHLRHHPPGWLLPWRKLWHWILVQGQQWR